MKRMAMLLLAFCFCLSCAFSEEESIVGVWGETEPMIVNNAESVSAATEDALRHPPFEQQCLEFADYSMVFLHYIEYWDYSCTGDKIIFSRSLPSGSEIADTSVALAADIEHSYFFGRDISLHPGETFEIELNYILCNEWLVLFDNTPSTEYKVYSKKGDNDGLVGKWSIHYSLDSAELSHFMDDPVGYISWVEFPDDGLDFYVCFDEQGECGMAQTVEYGQYTAQNGKLEWTYPDYLTGTSKFVTLDYHFENGLLVITGETGITVFDEILNSETNSVTFKRIQE